MAKRSAAPRRDGRDRIIDAAVRSFAERGYDGTTTAGVARDAGVTQPLVHKHFRSKMGLWRATVDRTFAGLAFFDERAIRSAPVDSAAAALLRFVEFNAAHALPHRLVLREGDRDTERLTYLLDRHLRVQLRTAVRSVRAAQRAGVIDRTIRPELLVLLALGAGSYLFGVGALARRGLGVDVRSEETQRAFGELVLEVMTGGVLRRDHLPASPASRRRRR